LKDRQKYSSSDLELVERESRSINRNIKITVDYIGRDFKGFQRQKNKPTVQGELEKALSILLRESIRVTGASRTDTGVNARGQIVNFRTKSDMSAERIMKSLNGLLPGGIAVTAVEDASPEFHARKSAAWREYEYLIWNRPYPEIFRGGYVTRIDRPLDTGLMKKAAESVVGEHDFSAFCVASSAVKGCVRNVTAVALDEPEPGLISLTIRADGFVHRMVRSLMGTLIDIGLGKLEPDTIKRMLESRDRKLAGRTAPAHGLTLTKIGY